MTPEEIAAAVQEYEYADDTRGTKGGTTQARRLIKALQLIGLNRKDFSVRTERKRIRDPYSGLRYTEYGDASGSIWNHEAEQLVIDNAATLVKCRISVHIIEGFERTMVFVSSSHPYRISRYNRATDKWSYEYPSA